MDCSVFTSAPHAKALGRQHRLLDLSSLVSLVPQSVLTWDEEVGGWGLPMRMCLGLNDLGPEEGPLAADEDGGQPIVHGGGLEEIIAEHVGGEVETGC